MNHRTRATIAAPAAYDVLGSLAELGHRLPQLLDQVGAGLRRSLHEHEVVDEARDPAASVEMAHAALREAASHARHLGRLLEHAQNAISQQGVRRSVPQHDHGHELRRDGPSTTRSRAAEAEMRVPFESPHVAPHRSQPEPPSLW